MKLIVEDDAAADPRAKGEVKHMFRAARRADPMLTKRGDVRIDQQDAVYAEARAKIISDRQIFPAGQGEWVLDESLDRVDRAAGADPDPADLRRSKASLLDHTCDQLVDAFHPIPCAAP